MKSLLTLFLAFISNIVISQYFQIDEVKEIDGNGFESVFPIVQSKLEQDSYSKIAAHRINTYLQYKLLGNVYEKDLSNIFKDVFPPEGEFHGQSEFSYVIHENNETIFSLTINYAATGAYMEYVNECFNFSSETGEHLTLDDLFNYDHRTRIGGEMARTCASQIEEFLEGVDESDSYAEDYHSLYDGCLEYFKELRDFPSNQFYFQQEEIVFKAYRCSNHMMAALDELWEFEIPFRLEDLKTSFRPEFVRVLFEKGNWVSIDDQAPSHKVLTGTVDGKYPITAVFSNLSGDYLYGVYWYDKYKKPIMLSGKKAEDGRYVFVEEINGKKIANVTFILKKDQFIGSWEKIDGSSSLPIVLRID